MPPSVHASAFAYRGVGCMVLGDSGSGKSRLVAEAITHGATLIADDQVVLSNRNGQLYAAPPDTIAGVLELYGMGIIRALGHEITHPIHLVVALSESDGDRIPEEKYYEYSDAKAPLLMLKNPHVPSLLLYLDAVREGRTLPADWLPRAKAS